MKFDRSAPCFICFTQDRETSVSVSYQHLRAVGFFWTRGACSSSAVWVAHQRFYSLNGEQLSDKSGFPCEKVNMANFDHRLCFYMTCL